VSRRKQEIEWYFQVGAELRRLSDEVLRGSLARSAASRRFWRPNIDICEGPYDYGITIELAGVDADSITILLVDQNSILVRGERQPPEPEDGYPRRSHQLEVFYVEFEREIDLPIDAKREAIRARFANGILTIVIPKRNSALAGKSHPTEHSHGRS
jgi:HSP20 family protein